MPPRKQRKPKRLAASIGKLTGGIYRKRGFPEARVLSDWPAIVGPALAAVTMPEQLNASGTLRVRVAGPQATELSHMEPEILERIAVYYGYRAARKLAFVQGPIPAGDDTPAPPPTATPAPEDARAIDQLVAPTADSSLKSALAALGRAVTQQEKR